MNTSYDVRIWSIDPYRGKSRTTYRVRWVVADKRFVSTFETRKLAESFRAKLLSAAREGVAFDEATGLSEPLARTKNSRSWYEHACAFVDMKWPNASPRHRKSIAESLATVTAALLASDRGKPDNDELRHALYTWSFNTTARRRTPSEAVDRAAQWASANTLSVADLADPAVMRRALDSLAVTLDGKTAAPTTIARKRAVFAGAVRYAGELGLLDSNPLDKVRWKTPKSTETVDRRVVVNHEQARRLLAAVRETHAPLEAFYACMYYAALRPAEALHLHARDCVLPDEGWGELLLTGSTQQTGTAWNDNGASRENRGLKHRARADTRIIPACPDLVTILRRHLDDFDTGPDGRLFVTRTGRFGRPVAGPYCNPVSTNTQSRVWQKAREKALTPAEFASPLAGRPYDLRHACVSTWLNAGVPAPQVAEWAGHSVDVLMRVYAKCIYGQEEAARKRIEAALKADSDSDGIDATGS
ncbi:MAG: tyrosine-type recombinase/integrase [Streptosporangiales bacterium]|nr:tyrosine-type recombinase/integrase [Streptosporangiales bacterium]